MIIKVELLLEVDESGYITSSVREAKTKFICSHILGEILHLLDYKDAPQVLEAKVHDFASDKVYK